MPETFQKIGLSSFEVEQRRKCCSERVQPSFQAGFWLRLYLRKFDDPLVRLLILVALVTFAVGFTQGDYFESLAIIGMILSITFLSLVGEWLAMRQFTQSMEEPDHAWAKVIRDSDLHVVSVRDLVPDDVVVLEPGDRIPAEGVLVDSFNFRVTPRQAGQGDPAQATGDEPAKGKTVIEGQGLWRLTGWPMLPSQETFLADAWQVDRGSPLWKQFEKLVEIFTPIAAIFALLMFFIMLLPGTGDPEFRLSTGQLWLLIALGIGLVVASTPRWLGEAYRLLAESGFEVTSDGVLPRDSRDTWIKSISIGVVSAIVFLGAGQVMGFMPIDPAAWVSAAFFQAVLRHFLLILAILIAVVPDGLGMHIVLGLVWSVRQMGVSGARVRRMQVAETLGAVTTVCHDLFGVMTKLKPRVEKVYFPNPAADCVADLNWDRLSEAIAATCSEASLCIPRSGEPLVIGEPTAGAILSWLHKQGKNPSKFRQRFVRLQKLESEPKRISAWVGFPRKISNHPAFFVRGTALSILDCCSSASDTLTSGSSARTFREPDLTAVDLDDLRTQFGELHDRGKICLGFAWKPLQQLSEPETLEGVRVEGMTWLGAVVLEDLPSEDYSRYKKACDLAGIRLILLTDEEPSVIKRVFAQNGLGAPASGFASHPASQPVSHLASEPASHLASEPASHLASEPASHLASEPASHLASEPASHPASQPVSYLASEPASHLASEPASHPASQPVSYLASEPASHLASEPASQPESEPASQPASGPEVVRVSPSLSPDGCGKRNFMEGLRRSNSGSGTELFAALGCRVDDIPAMASAQIGLALGPLSSQSVKESSDVVLTEASLQPFLRAVAIGRAFYRNLRRFLVFQAVTNFLILGINLLSPLLGLGFPLTVLQMLWIQFILDTVTALALATEAPDPDILDRPPSDVTEPLLTWAMGRVILAQSVLVLAGFLGLLAIIHSVAPGTPHSHSVLFSAFVFLIFWVLWTSRWLGTKNPHANRAWDNPWYIWMAACIVFGQMLIVQTGGSLFQTAPLTGFEWFGLFAGTGLYVWLGGALLEGNAAKPAIGTM